MQAPVEEQYVPAVNGELDPIRTLQRTLATPAPWLP